MSDTANVGAIEYVASIDLTEFIKNQREVEGRLTDLEKGGDRLGVAMTAVARAVAGLFASGAIAAGMKAAVAASAKFESKLADLSAVTGATGDDLDRLAKAADKFARTTTASAGDAVEAMKLIASGKPDLLNTKGALEDVTAAAITLSEAARMDLPAAADALVTSLNQFNESADQSNRYINVLAAGAKYGASEISDTAVALKNSGVSAASAKVSFEEANAAIQALAAAGIKGGEAGTALRNVLLKLETETTGKTKPSISGLAGALEALNAQHKSAADLVKLFGSENVNAAQALLRSAGNVRELTAQLTGTNTAQEQATTNTSTLEAAITKMNNTVELAVRRFGDELAPSVLKAVQGITALAAEFADGDGAAKTLLKTLEGMAVIIGGSLLGQLAAAAIRFAAVEGAVGLATTAVAGFRAALALLGGPIGIAITALGLLVLNWDKIAPSAKSAAEISEESANRIASALKRASDGAKTADLSAKLKEDTQAMADAKQALINLQVGTYGKGTPEQIDAAKARVDARKQAIEDTKRAMNSLGGGAGRGSINPPTVDQISTPDKAGPDAPKKTGFDAEAYLSALRQANLQGLALIDERERAALAVAQKHYGEGELDKAKFEAAKTEIEAKAQADRDKLWQQVQDAQKAAEQDELRRKRETLAQEIEAEKRAQAEKQQGRDFATGIIAEQDPVAKLQFELQAKSALLAQYAEQDMANLTLYAQAKVALEQQTQAQIVAAVQARHDAENQLMSAQLTNYSNLFGAMADMTGAFAGKQSAAYKAMFAVSKAFAIADAIMKIQQGIANAMSLPWPANLAAAASTAAAAAGIVSTIKSTSFGGGRQYGGPVNAGTMYRVNETGKPEMYTAASGEQYMLPNKSGKVTPANKVGASEAQQPSFSFGDMHLNLQGVPMPNGMFAINPGDLADAIRRAQRDMFFTGRL